MFSPTLIDRIRAKDKRALRAFYRTFQPKLSAYIRRKIHNPADAEEVLQDTLFAFLEAVRDYTGSSSPRTFLYGICNHKIADYYRKKRIAQVLFSQMPSLEKLVSPVLGPEESFDAVVLAERIQVAMRGILPRYRKLLRHKYVYGYSVYELARASATTVKSAESALSRARKAFIRAFSET